MTEPLAVGADLGGSSTRVLAVDAAGIQRGSGRSGGGNPTTHGTASAAAALRAALLDALDGRGSQVEAIVLGMAGGGALLDPAVAAEYRAMLHSLGIDAEPVVVGDALCAFCSATPEADGTVLLAGTGAAAARVRAHRMAELADGLGWLLGDDGSAYWIGREAVRAVLAELAGVGPATRLREPILTRLLPPGAPAGGEAARNAVIRAVVGRPPIELALFATEVSAAAGADAAAARICDRAAEQLLATLAAVRSSEERGPLVLNGSVVRDPAGPVGARLRALIGARFAGPVLVPADGTAGAAWLALRAMVGAPAATTAHARLISTL